MLKIFTLSGLAMASAFDETKLVEKINSTPDVLWKAEVNGFNGRSFKTLLGVKQGESYDAVQKLPRHVSTIRDEDIPDSFDSETNWPQCAKVIGDIRDQSMYVKNCDCRCQDNCFLLF
jgi:hypothetical protein